MNGTNHSTSGFLMTRVGETPVINREPASRLRLLGFLLTALFGSVLVVWASFITWQRADILQHRFSSLNADSFYAGVRMRGDIERLNDTLLRYRLHGDPADADAFRAGTRDFKARLARYNANAATPLEKDFFQRIGAAYADYLTDSARVLESTRAHWSSTQLARDFQDNYETVVQQSEDLLSLCDTFIDNQRSDFDNFLKGSNRTLANFKQLLAFSAALLIVFGALVLLLIYRGLIEPLRHRLTESTAIIARQEKLASLGVLAAGVAHEIRNPLTAIKFRLFSLKKLLPAAAAEDAGVITQEIARLERIVKDFLEFARPSEPDLVAVPVLRVVQQVRDLLQPQLEKSAIRLQLEESPPLWINADIQQIKQVLINLIQNSADSIGRDGVITLRVRGRKAAVIIEVIDSGKGIPPDVQKRLFDPFFTTKEGGTGLGLPIAARIVEKHGGKIRFHTTDNHGTTFRVVLPAAEEEDEGQNIID